MMGYPIQCDRQCGECDFPEYDRKHLVDRCESLDGFGPPPDDDPDTDDSPWTTVPGDCPPWQSIDETKFPEYREWVRQLQEA